LKLSNPSGPYPFAKKTGGRLEGDFCLEKPQMRASHTFFNGFWCLFSFPFLYVILFCIAIYMVA
jgi:hypothetical protein